MKQLILAIASLQLALAALGSPIGKTMGDVESFPIIRGTSEEGGDQRPRTPSLFSAYLDTDLNLITIYTLYNVGYVDTVIENLTTGEYAEYSFNSSSPVLLPISGNAGYWHITRTLGSGEEYQGEFVI